MTDWITGWWEAFWNNDVFVQYPFTKTLFVGVVSLLIISLSFKLASSLVGNARLNTRIKKGLSNPPKTLPKKKVRAEKKERSFVYLNAFHAAAFRRFGLSYVKNMEDAMRKYTVDEWKDAAEWSRTGVYPEDAVKLLGTFPDPKALLAGGWIVFFVGLVNLVLFVVAQQNIGDRAGTIAYWSAVVLAVGAPLVLGFIVWNAGSALRMGYEEVEMRAQPGIQELVVRINRFARRQEKYRLLSELKTIEWEDWARRNFLRMLEEWKPDIAEWDEISGHSRFAYAVKQWSLGGQKESDLLHIWERRREIWQWARFRDTSEARFKVGLESSQAIEDALHIAEQEANTLRSMLKTDE